MKKEANLFGLDAFSHRYFAHRGLHDLKKSIPENSLSAFKAACDAGYGVELDVRLSKDEQVVIFHDSNLKRICGIDANVEDLTYDELKNLDMSGTGEGLALFKDVLEVFAKSDRPLIVEIKNGNKNRLLCEKTYGLLKAYDVVYCVESFNPLILKWFRSHAPQVIRGQLSGSKEMYDDKIPGLIVKLLTICAFNFISKPHFIAYELNKRPERILKLRKKGMMLVGWTSRSPEDDLSENDALIFEGYLPSIRY